MRATRKAASTTSSTNLSDRSGASHARTLFRVALPIAVFALALWLLHDLLREFHPRAVAAALDALRPRQWVLALALTALGYLILTLCDVLALRA